MENPRKRTVYDWALEILSFLSLIWALIPLAHYGNISTEQRIPIHYNTLGEIDGWGDRSFLFYISLGAVLFYVGLSLLDKYYSKFNYPIKVTENNANALYRLRVRLIRHMKLITVLLFAYTSNATLAVTMGKETGINPFIMDALLVATFLSLIFYFIKMFRLREHNR